MSESTCATQSRKLEDGDSLLNAEYCNAINKALLIGLASFGEIERVIDNVEGAKLVLGPDDKTLSILNACRPLHPTGSAETVGIFATALHLIYLLRRE